MARTTEHGTSEVTLVDNIIRAKLSGSFNRQGCALYTERVKQIVATLNAQPFAMLIDDLDLEGGTPAAYQALQDYNVWLNRQAIVAKAFIINNNVTKHIILQRSPALLEQNIAFFNNYDDATLWLKQQLSEAC